jgi:acetyl-CoA carboxylase carboxyl transferase subunit beta
MPWPDKKSPDSDAENKRTLGKGVFRKCDGCGETLPAEALTRNHEVCPT